VNKTIRGFTLIEVMMVVAILAIAVAFGLPSYRDQVMKSRRAEGMGELLELADRLERFYSDRGSYEEATLGNGSTDLYRATTDKNYYALRIDVQDAMTFTVSAAPQGTQAKDKCGIFTLTSLGIKSVSGGSLTANDCWK